MRASVRGSTRFALGIPEELPGIGGRHERNRANALAGYLTKLLKCKTLKERVTYIYSKELPTLKHR